MVTEEESRQVAEWLPNGRFEALDGTKHPFEQVEPERIVSVLVREF